MKILRAHPRFFISFVLGFLILLVLPYFGITNRISQAIIGYDTSILIYVGWALSLMFKSKTSDIQQRALTQNDGKFTVLFLVFMALLFSMIVIFVDLSSVKNLIGSEKYERLILSILTIVLSWFFLQLAFALHYAHDYYYETQHRRAGGLIFLPENESPDYFDFLYFSIVLGATAQTADVTLSSKNMRRTCLFHSMIAFFFNTTLLAITINMASGIL